MKENAFAVPLRSKSRVNQRAWGIAIVDRAVLGQADRSMLLHFGSLMRCVSLRVQSMSAYAETALPLRDGLPKFKDFPAEFGGSGEQIAE